MLAQGRLDEAAVLHRDAVIRYQITSGNTALVAVALSNLGYTEGERGRFAEAEALYREAVPVLDSVWRGTPRLANTLVDYGRILRQRAKCGEAEPILRLALATLEPEGPASVPVLRTQRILGGCLFDLRRYPAAESLLVAAHRNLDQAFGPTNPYTVEAAADVARLYRAWQPR